MTDKRPHVGSTAKAMLTVSTANRGSVETCAQVDPGGSQNLASREILQNIRSAEEYDRTPICMVTVSGDTPAYHNISTVH